MEKVELGTADSNRERETVCSQRHHTKLPSRVQCFSRIYLRQAPKLSDFKKFMSEVARLSSTFPGERRYSTDLELNDYFFKRVPSQAAHVCLHGEHRATRQHQSSRPMRQDIRQRQRPPFSRRAFTNDAECNSPVFDLIMVHG